MSVMLLDVLRRYSWCRVLLQEKKGGGRKLSGHRPLLITAWIVLEMIGETHSECPSAVESLVGFLGGA